MHETGTLGEQIVLLKSLFLLSFMIKQEVYDMGMKTKKYRVRDRDIHIMVTDYEDKLIRQRMKASGKSTLREYLVDMAVNGYIIKVDYSEMKNLVYEINKIGTNINQIAYKANSTNHISQIDIDELKDKVDLIWRLLRSKFFQLPREK